MQRCILGMDGQSLNKELCAYKLLSLREQLSSAIEEIDAVVGKEGQIQQNINTREKQVDNKEATK